MIETLGVSNGNKSKYKHIYNLILKHDYKNDYFKPVHITNKYGAN